VEKQPLLVMMFVLIKETLSSLYEKEIVLLNLKKVSQRFSGGNELLFSLSRQLMGWVIK